LQNIFSILVTLVAKNSVIPFNLDSKFLTPKELFWPRSMILATTESLMYLSQCIEMIQGKRWLIETPFLQMLAFLTLR